MVNKNTTIGVLVFLGLILILGFLAFANQGTFGFSTAQTQQSFIQSPAFGWYECRTSGSPITLPIKAIETQPSTRINDIDWNIFTCNDFAENDGCQITLIREDDQDIPFFNTFLAWSICDTSGFCGVTKSESFLTDRFFTESIRLDANQYLFVSYQQDTFGLITDTVNVEGITYTGTITPFFLFQTDIFHVGNIVINRENCEVPNVNKNRIIQSSTIDALIGTTPIPPNKINKGEPVNYISTFVPLSRENAEFQTLNGELVQCRNKNLFSIEEVKFGNTDYLIANSNLQDSLKEVQCCNGDFLPGFVCEDNKWIEEEQQGSCGAFNPCPGSAQFREDTTNPGVFVISQCTEQNVCELTEIRAQCSSNTGCASNEVCNIDVNNPLNNKCINVEPGTDPLPDLPGQQPPSTGFGLTQLLILLVALGAAVFGTFMADKNLKIDNQIVRWIVNVVMFLIIIILVTLLLSAIITALASSFTIIAISLIIGFIIAMMARKSVSDLPMAVQIITFIIVLLVVATIVFFFLDTFFGGLTGNILGGFLG